MQQDTVVLTGDRTTGPLHLGHYVGSLKQRVELQQKYKQFVMLADIQGLTDSYEDPAKIRNNVYQVMLDYLAVGIDPARTTIFVQSMIPQIAELTILYLNLVSVNRLKRNPTVKNEIQQKGYGEQVTAGFLMYPVHQAADITIVKGTLVPVGVDQLPMIEQTNEIIKSFNRIYNVELFKPVEALLSSSGSRLPGIDGKAKMSKSLSNAINLSDSADIVAQKVMKMYTDPAHVQAKDPGTVEGNTVFTYLDIFDSRTHEVETLKVQYRQGGLGDVTLKKRLIEVLNNLLEPIRLKRAEYQNNLDYVKKVLQEGTAHTQEIAHNTMQQVRKAIKLDYF